MFVGASSPDSRGIVTFAMSRTADLSRSLTPREAYLPADVVNHPEVVAARRSNLGSSCYLETDRATTHPQHDEQVEGEPEGDYRGRYVNIAAAGVRRLNG